MCVPTFPGEAARAVTGPGFDVRAFWSQIEAGKTLIVEFGGATSTFDLTASASSLADMRKSCAANS